MQLAEPLTVSMPKQEEEQSLILTPSSLKKCRKQGLQLEWYVLFAIQMTYGGQSRPSIVKGNFCEEWNITEDQFDSAIAKQQKKGNVHRPDVAVQLELFATGEE